MFLEIVTPEASIFQGDVESVIVPGVVGEFQILNNHAPIVSLLKEGKVRIRGSFTLDEAYEGKFSNGDNRKTSGCHNCGICRYRQCCLYALSLQLDRLRFGPSH